MAKARVAHQDAIDATLRGIIAVQPVEGGFLSSEGFWNRCHLINADWRESLPNRIYVDGYLGGCNWNSWRTRCIATEEGLDGVEIYYGYAFGSGQWSEHCWCMRNDVIIETTGEMIIYYGTSLNEAELKTLTELCENHDPIPVTNGEFWGEFNRVRYRIPLDDDDRPPHIGHRVDQKNGEPIPQLGLSEA